MEVKKGKNPLSFSIDVTPLIEEIQKIDPHGLIGFLMAQDKNYEKAFQEIKNGHKEGDWMYYIFPQLKGLDTDESSNRYGIKNLEVAEAYYNVYNLHYNLLNISKALLALDKDNILDIFDYPDNLKLQSCMTLFELVDDEEPVFKQVLDKYYNGERDQKTIDMINKDDD